MKKSYLLLAFSLLLSMSFVNSLISNSGGSPSGRSGSPIDTGTCKASGCHNTFDLNSGNATLSLGSNIPATGYVPGMTYTINVNITELGTTRFGFQASAYSKDQNANVGAVTILNSMETRVNPGMGNYVTHTRDGIDGTDSKDWSFDWTAPNPGVGEVSFYVAGMASNRNGSPAGDHVYTVADTFIQGAGVSIEPIRELFQAKVYPTLAEEFVFVEIENLQRSKVELRITKLDGQQLYSLNQEQTSASFSTRIPVQNWASGVYIMTISHAGKVGYEKFVVK